MHFHEVGAIDAIGEIVGVALALESLGIDKVICSPLPMGRGFVKAAHGNLPLPAPATLELLHGAPIHGVEVELELVTPTGAALVAALAEAYGPLPRMTLDQTGYGSGTRDLKPFPNVVRAIIGTEATSGTVEPDRGQPRRPSARAGARRRRGAASPPARSTSGPRPPR